MKNLFARHQELMHYTSAAGLRGILTSKTLWASHTSFLNDSEEVIGFFDRVLPDILKPSLERHVRDSAGVAAHIESAKRLGFNLFDHWLKKINEGCKDAELHVSDHYVASFCTTDDVWVSQNGLLSQWRGYGTDGGYAIVFDSAGLEALMMEESRLYFEEVSMWADAEYRMSDIANIKDDQVLDLIKKVQESMCTYLTTGDTDEFDFESLSKLSVVCKHRGFEEEKEVRIVVTEPSALIPPDCDGSDGKPYRKLHSYIRGGSSVPCIHLFEDLKLQTLPIRRIVVGPHLGKIERKKGVELLLHDNGIDSEVLVSETPFRGK